MKASPLPGALIFNFEVKPEDYIRSYMQQRDR